MHFQEILRFSKQRRELGAAVSVDDPVIKLASSNKQDFLIGDMKRLWRSLEGQEDVGVVGGAKGEAEGSNNRSGSKQDVIQVMGDMKQLLWKSFVGPAPDNSSI